MAIDKRKMHAIEMDRAEQFIYRQAELYIANRDCKFELLRHNDITKDCVNYTLRFHTGDRAVTRNHTHYWDHKTNESLDLMVSMLTHMAIDIGLIETTPKEITHNLSLTGTDGGNAEVQIDGHTLRGLYSFEVKVDASGECKAELGFSRAKIFLDQDFLPENMTLKIQGMDELLGIGDRLAKAHRKGLGNVEYAKSVPEGMAELWQELNDALHTYTPIQTGESPKVH